MYCMHTLLRSVFRFYTYLQTNFQNFQRTLETAKNVPKYFQMFPPAYFLNLVQRYDKFLIFQNIFIHISK